MQSDPLRPMSGSADFWHQSLHASVRPSLTQYIDTPFSVPDWHLPSPSSTPTSAGFDPNAGQRPKSGSFTGFFPNGLATPRPADAASYQMQAPMGNGFQTPLQRPVSSSSMTGPEDPKFHVNYFSPNPDAPLPPVNPSQRLASTPSESTFQPPQMPLSAPQTSPTAPVLDSSQMQTPPPTRDSSSRKKAAAPTLMPSTPSTIASKRFSTPAGFGASPNNESVFFQTPMQFPSLQFTPDMSSLSNNGPATAPVFPQNDIFWDQADSMDVDVLQPSNPFDISPRPDGIFHTEWNANGNTALNTTGHRSSLPVSEEEHISPGTANPFRSITTSIPPSETLTNSNARNVSAVNPSMLLNFSKPTDTTSQMSVSPIDGQPSTATRQPYEHQMQESNREREMMRISRQNASRMSTGPSTASIQATVRPGIQRSNTDSGFRRRENAPASLRQAGPIAQIVNDNNSAHQIPRNASPLKRLSSGPLAPIFEAAKPRPKMRLVVDEDGRARTEAIPATEMRTAEKRLSSQLSPSWDEESSDTDSSPDLHIHSQSNSFAFPRPPSRPSKAARNSLGGSRPTTSSSSGFGPGTTGLRSHAGSGGSSFDAQTRRCSGSSLSGANDDLHQRSDSAMAIDAGDAHAALQRVMESRNKRQENRKSLDQLQAHNQRWARASADMSKFSTHQFTASQNLSSRPSSSISFSSPMPQSSAPDVQPLSRGTTVSKAPAASQVARSTNGASASRCVCNNRFASLPGGVVQCDYCAHSLHAVCVGVDLGSPPPVFLCAFCTGEAATVDHGFTQGGPVRV